MLPLASRRYSCAFKSALQTKGIEQRFDLLLAPVALGLVLGSEGVAQALGAVADLHGSADQGGDLLLDSLGGCLLGGFVLLECRFHLSYRLLEGVNDLLHVGRVGLLQFGLALPKHLIGGVLHLLLHDSQCLLVALVFGLDGLLVALLESMDSIAVRLVFGCRQFAGMLLGILLDLLKDITAGILHTAQHKECHDGG